MTFRTAIKELLVEKIGFTPRGRNEQNPKSEMRKAETFTEMPKLIKVIDWKRK